MGAWVVAIGAVVSQLQSQMCRTLFYLAFCYYMVREYLCQLFSCNVMFRQANTVV